MTPLSIGVRSMRSSNNGRSENQDNYVLIHEGSARFLQDQQQISQAANACPADHWRLAVIDGMGGPGNGREIAEALAQAIATLPPALSQTALNQRLDSIHQQLITQWQHSEPSPGATLTLLERADTQHARLYHVGDSRLYAITENSIDCLTIDHVPATQALLKGLLNTQEWHQQVFCENRSTISQAVGLRNNSLNPSLSGRASSAELFELNAQQLPTPLQQLADRRTIALNENTLYLLASDGLWDYPEPEQWLQQLPDIYKKWPKPQAFVNELFTRMIINPPTDNAADNATAIAFCMSD